MKILVREKSPLFFDLQSMLLVQENHVRTKNKMLEGQMIFLNSNGGRGQGRGKRGRFDQGRAGRFGPSHESSSNIQLEKGSTRGKFGRRESFQAGQGRQNKPLATIVGRSATMKRSVERREASRSP